MNIVECRHCGKAWWSDVAGGPIDGGPCCFGHPVLDVDRHPSEKSAESAFPAWQKADAEAVRKAAAMNGARNQGG